MENKEEQKSEIMTEVTSIAEQEQKSGKQIMNINSEQLIHMSSMNMVVTLSKLEKLLKNMSAKQIRQAVIGGLDFPKDNLPVKWVEKKGKIVTPKPGYADIVDAFMMIQRVISDRFVLTQKHVIDQIRQIKDKESSKESDNSTDNNKVTNEEVKTNE